MTVWLDVEGWDQIQMTVVYAPGDGVERRSFVRDIEKHAPRAPHRNQMVAGNFNCAPQLSRTLISRDHREPMRATSMQNYVLHFDVRSWRAPGVMFDKTHFDRRSNNDWQDSLLVLVDKYLVEFLFKDKDVVEHALRSCPRQVQEVELGAFSSKFICLNFVFSVYLFMPFHVVDVLIVFFCCTFCSFLFLYLLLQKNRNRGAKASRLTKGIRASAQVEFRSQPGANVSCPRNFVQ